MSEQAAENPSKKYICAGLLAHVDAGKTTLSEGLLYQGGHLRKLGRVDHQDTFLDTDSLERERGITIFSKQAILPLDELEITLLDTPGHVDFSGEMERTLQVLDCAILVISGTDAIQGHTMTLWQLLARRKIPVFLFINKMDLPGSDHDAILEQLHQRFGSGCIDFAQQNDSFVENLALCGENALASYLHDGTVSTEEIAKMVQQRAVFPCYFGSALKLDGVDALLDGLKQYAPAPVYPSTFGARIFKISRDPQGNRLTWLKLTGGSLSVKMVLSGGQWEEKINQIRLYSGTKFQLTETVYPGQICAVTGLNQSHPGEGLGIESAGEPPCLAPVFTNQLILPEGCSPHTALQKLAQLEEEDPQLRIVWNEQLQEIHLQLMGEVQMEILQRLILERFGLEVKFGASNIVYRETIAQPVEGVGHFEPLRHYSEVHLLLEPGEPGSGMQFASTCPEEQLDRNWQRLILTHLEERTHLGVLTGSPITDLKITLVSGRAHEKHTEGGDFRQATYRAVRQGLMSAKSVLLEPWYEVRLELPTESVGRAMADLQRMSGNFSPPQTIGEETILTGAAPVSCLQNYAAEVASYTRGRGRLSCMLKGYQPCHNAAEVITGTGYDPERDLENTADSVFCAHGAGFTVKWDEVPAYMHLESILKPTVLEPESAPIRRASPSRSPGGSLEEDKELLAIFERTYGAVGRRGFESPPRPETDAEQEIQTLWNTPWEQQTEYLLVDGYNIIFAWDDLKQIARENLDAARKALMDLLCNYQGFKKCELILVFDAYKVPGNPGSVSRYHNIHVVYTKEAETADAYIEKTTYEIGRKHRVRVATSDSAEQLIILGHGALRISAKSFRAEVEQVGGQISQILSENRRRLKSQLIKDAFDRASRK